MIVYYVCRTIVKNYYFKHICNFIYINLYILMSEIEALTKTLVNVIGSLKEIINKKGGIEGIQKQ